MVLGTGMYTFRRKKKTCSNLLIRLIGSMSAIPSQKNTFASAVFLDHSTIHLVPRQKHTFGFRYLLHNPHAARSG